MNRLLSLSGLALMVLLGACGGEGVGDGPEPTFTLPTLRTDVPTDEPNTPTPDTRTYQLYMERKPQFVLTWEYETQVPIDLQAGEDRAFADGVLTCGLIDEFSPATIVEEIERESSWTLSGAEAVVAAAVRDLCPESNARFITAFDENVDTARQAIQNESGVSPAVVEVGQTAKVVCEYLDRNPRVEGLAEYIQNVFQSEGWLAGVSHKVAVRAVVSYHCPEHDLGGYWYNP